MWMNFAFVFQFLAPWDALFLSLEEVILENRPTLLEPPSLQGLFTYGSSKKIPEETKVSCLASNNPQSHGLYSEAAPKHHIYSKVACTSSLSVQVPCGIFHCLCQEAVSAFQETPGLFVIHCVASAADVRVVTVPHDN